MLLLRSFNNRCLLGVGRGDGIGVGIGDGSSVIGERHRYCSLGTSSVITGPDIVVEQGEP